MTEAIEAAITAITGIVAAVSGIRQAPNYPQETQNVDPFCVTYLQTGSIAASPIGTKKALVNIAVDLLIPKVDLARDMTRLTPFLDTIPAALIGQVAGTGGRFSNTITTFEGIEITFMPNVDYAGVPMRGYSFVMTNVKFLIAL